MANRGSATIPLQAQRIKLRRYIQLSYVAALAVQPFLVFISLVSTSNFKRVIMVLQFKRFIAALCCLNDSRSIDRFEARLNPVGFYGAKEGEALIVSPGRVGGW